MPGPEAAGSRFQPLRLPSRSSLLVRAATVVLQRAQGLQISLGGHPWILHLSDAQSAGGVGDTPGPSGIASWVVDLMWGSAPYQLALSADAPLAWLHDLMPGTHWTALPDPIAKALIESVGHLVLRQAGSAERSQLRLLRIEKSEAVTHRQEAIWHLTLRSNAARINGWLSTGDQGVIHLATQLRSRQPSPGPLAVPALPLILHAQLGFSWLTLTGLSNLRAGDVLIVQRPLLAPDGELWVACGSEGLRARQVQGQWVMTQPWQPGGWGMHPDDPDESGPSLGSANHLRHLPLRVTFDVGALQLSVGELAQLQPGQALDMQRPVSEAVHVRVNGVLIGMGELIDIDGRMGVVLRALNAGGLDADAIPPALAPIEPLDPEGESGSPESLTPDLPPEEA